MIEAMSVESRSSGFTDVLEHLYLYSFVARLIDTHLVALIPMLIRLQSEHRETERQLNTPRVLTSCCQCLRRTKSHQLQGSRRLIAQITHLQR